MTSMPLDGMTPAQGAPQSGSILDKLSSILPPQILALKEQEQKKKWAVWVETEYQKCKTARVPYERQWYINLAFYHGRQYVQPMEVANHGFRLMSPRTEPWRVRMVINKIRTAVITECSKLTSSRPIPTVVPASNEDEDFMAARVGEQLLKSAFANSQFEKDYRSAIWWAVVTGNAYLKSYWDPSFKDPEVQLPPQAVMGLDGKPMIDPATQRPITAPPQPVLGKICVERVTPFHIYVPDMLSEDINLQPYVIHAMTRTVAWAKNTFGINAVPDSQSTNTILESAVLTPKGSQTHLDSVLVKEIWLKPGAHPDFPEGGMMTVINSQVVQVQPKWPWPFKEFPFYKIDGMPTGAFYTDSRVVDLIPVQKEYNRTKSQMIEIKNIMGKPKIMYQQGSLDPRKINSDPGQAIPYRAGYNPPTVIPGTDVPATMPMELDRLTSDFDDISGQHEITRGSTPSQVTSGTAIAFLQEQDDSKLGYQVSGIEHCIETLGKHYLKYVSNYWTEERLIRVAGLDNAYEAKHWKGSDLRGNTDVRIQTGSALPVSKAAKQALLTEFMMNGWIDPTTGLEMLDFGGLDKMLEDVLVDKRQAQRENMKLADMDPALIGLLLTPEPDPLAQQPTLPGMPPVGPGMGDPTMGGMEHQPQPQPPMPVNSWDNHEVHIHIHNQFRKTQQFELLAPEVKQAFELHVQLHQMALLGNIQGVAGPLNSPPSGPGQPVEEGGEPPVDGSGGPQEEEASPFPPE